MEGKNNNKKKKKPQLSPSLWELQCFKSTFFFNLLYHYNQRTWLWFCYLDVSVSMLVDRKTHGIYSAG